MASSNPLEIAVRGYTALRIGGPGNHQFAVTGGYTMDEPSRLRSSEPGNIVVVNMKRARWLLREFHDWDIADEHELLAERMKGNIAE